MSRYIDIVKIMRENKEFKLELEIKEYKKNKLKGEINCSYDCVVYKNGISVVNKYNEINLFEVKEDESRSKSAKRFMEFMYLYDMANKDTYKIKVTINDYSFFLNNRGWRV